MQTSNNDSAVEARLRNALANGDEDAALRAVATAEVVLPQADDEAEAPEGGISLPVIEQDGTQFVPVFTSERVMSAAAPEVSTAVMVLASELAEAWPDEELWMAVNPGTPDGMALPPYVVRMLPAYARL